MAELDGILAFDKSPGMTSHDAIVCLRRLLLGVKIGHTGTLDPMASGLMLICLGRATKVTQFLTDWSKSYRAEMTLGKVSETYDSDGQVTEGGAIPGLTQTSLQEMLTRDFTGSIRQQVPAYSAVKHQGRELYKYARQGVEIELPEREVEVASITVVDYAEPILSLNIDCGKGTYIRALANDIGRILGCGAILSKLRRLSVGPVSVSQALALDGIAEAAKTGDLERRIIPLTQLLDFPRVNVREEATEIIRNGGYPAISQVTGYGPFRTGQYISMISEKGTVLAIGKSRCDAASLTASPKKDFYSYVRVLI